MEHSRRCLLAGRWGWILGAACLASPTCARGEEPRALLARTMDRYASLRTFGARSILRMPADGTPGEPAGMRSFFYARPNRFRLVVSRPGCPPIQVVCDGRQVVEVPGGPSGRRVSPAPRSLQEAASQALTDPRLGGSLLFRLFSGARGLPALLEPGSRVEERPPESVHGVACRTLRFRARPPFGQVTVSIGRSDGLVRRIVCRSGPDPARVPARLRGKLPTGGSFEEDLSWITVDRPLGKSLFDLDDKGKGGR